MALQINFKTLDGLNVVNGCVEISAGSINQVNMNVGLTFWSCKEAKVLGYIPCQMANTNLNIAFDDLSSQRLQAYNYLKSIYPEATEVEMTQVVIPEIFKIIS